MTHREAPQPYRLRTIGGQHIRRWYHGGVRGLEPGDLVLPASETGAKGAHAQFMQSSVAYQHGPASRYRPDLVYVTPGWEEAGKWAGLLPGCNRRSHYRPGVCAARNCVPDPFSKFGGDLYEVRPAAPVEPDPTFTFEGLFPDLAVTSSAEVLRVVARGAPRQHITAMAALMPSGGTWYLADRPGREPGEVLAPADDPAALEFSSLLYGTQRDDRVFITKTRDVALAHAEQSAYGTAERGGTVYQVEPAGEVETDPYLSMFDCTAAAAPAVSIIAAVDSDVPRAFVLEWTGSHMAMQRNVWIDYANAVRRAEGLEDLDPAAVWSETRS